MFEWEDRYFTLIWFACCLNITRNVYDGHDSATVNIFSVNTLNFGDVDIYSMLSLKMMCYPADFS